MIKTDFIDYLKQLKAEDWNKMATEKWTVKDVVAHMVGWEKDDPETIKKIWKTRQAPWFMKTDDYDNFNQKAVEFYKNYTPSQLIEEFEKWQNVTQKQIDLIGEEKLRAYPELFGWLFDETDNSHCNHHLRQIKNVLSHN
jgi:hypothetical protein